MQNIMKSFGYQLRRGKVNSSHFQFPNTLSRIHLLPCNHPCTSFQAIPIFNCKTYFKSVGETSKEKTFENENQFGFGRYSKIAERLVKASPSAIQPYLQLMRLDRPIGTWLLFWPCAWSIAVAGPAASLPDPFFLSVFASGALIMRGGGCTINDMWDKDIDNKVERTTQRPLACGALSMLDAWVFLGMQLSIGCCILLSLNWNAILLGASSLGLVVLYPLMKRFTYWPQLMLGFTFNWGALLGWTAIHGSCDLFICLPLYLSGVAWTMIYDTIYAHQDKYDDVIIGIKSTALKFGQDTTKWLSVFGLIMSSGLVVTGLNAELSWPFYIAVAAAAGHVINQIRTLKIDDSEDCGKKFRANRHLGLLIFLGIVGGNLLKIPKDEIEDGSNVPNKDDIT